MGIVKLKVSILVLLVTLIGFATESGSTSFYVENAPPAADRLLYWNGGVDSLGLSPTTPSVDSVREATTVMVPGIMLGVVAVDGSPTVTSNGTIDGFVVGGDAPITLFGEDSFGNWTQLDSDPVEVEAGSVYLGAGATFDSDITASIVTVNPVDSRVTGAYTVTYDVSDSSGITIGTVQDVVTMLVYSAPSDVTAPNSISVKAEGAPALDLVDRTVAVTSDAPVPFLLGTTIVTYSATDSAGDTMVLSWSDSHEPVDEWDFLGIGRLNSANESVSATIKIKNKGTGSIHWKFSASVSNGDAGWVWIDSKDNYSARMVKFDGPRARYTGSLVASGGLTNLLMTLSGTQFTLLNFLAVFGLLFALVYKFWEDFFPSKDKAPPH